MKVNPIRQCRIENVGTSVRWARHGMDYRPDGRISLVEYASRADMWHTGSHHVY